MTIIQRRINVSTLMRRCINSISLLGRVTIPFSWISPYRYSFFKKKTKQKKKKTPDLWHNLIANFGFFRTGLRRTKSPFITLQLIILQLFLIAWFPAGTSPLFNIASTAMQRHDAVWTLSQRCAPAGFGFGSIHLLMLSCNTLDEVILVPSRFRFSQSINQSNLFIVHSVHFTWQHEVFQN